MTTAGAIVTSAYREGNLVAVGAAPTPDEAAEGLDALNRLVLATFGFTIGNKLRDWQVPRRQGTGTVTRDFPLLPGAERSLVPTYPLYPALNSRVIWDGSAQTIFFDPLPQDGAVMAVAKGSGADSAVPGVLIIDGNGRTIGGQNTVTFSGVVTPTRWFYRADLADWSVAAAVAADVEMLFPPELDDLWICALAIRMAPRYGKQVAPSTSARFTEMSTILRTRYQQTAPTSSGGEELRPGYESYSSGYQWMR